MAAAAVVPVVADLMVVLVEQGDLVVLVVKMMPNVEMQIVTLIQKVVVVVEALLEVLMEIAQQSQ